MSKKTTVILPTAGQFRRTVRKDGQPVLDAAGNPRVLLFNSRQAVELTPEELESVADDIGNVLHIAKTDEGKPTVKVDGKATADFVKAHAEAKAKATAKADKAEAALKAPEPPLAVRRDHETKAK